MVRTRTIPLSDAAAWAEALAGIPHGIAHTYGYNAALAPDDTFLFVAEGEGGRTVCPLAPRPFGDAMDLVTPYGFGGFAGALPRGFAEAWSDFVRERGYVCGYLGLNPLFAPAGLEPLHLAASIYALDLTPSLETLHQAFHKSFRYRLRRWEREGFVLHDDRPALEAAFVRLYPDFVRRIGAADVYHFPDQSLRKLAALESVLPIGAGPPGRIESVSLFGYTPFGGHFLLNAATPDGRDHSIPIMAEAIRLLQARGIPALNLGGGVRPGDGLALFKSRFGSYEMPSFCLKQIYDTAAFDRLCREAGRDPALDGYFPPYRAAA